MECRKIWKNARLVTGWAEQSADKSRSRTSTEQHEEKTLQYIFDLGYKSPPSALMYAHMRRVFFKVCSGSKAGNDLLDDRSPVLLWSKFDKTPATKRTRNHQGSFSLDQFIRVMMRIMSHPNLRRATG